MFYKKIKTFRTDATKITSEKFEYTQSTLIRFLSDLNELFEELIRMSEKPIDVAFVLKCSDSLKNLVKKIGKTVFFQVCTYIVFSFRHKIFLTEQIFTVT